MKSKKKTSFVCPLYIQPVTLENFEFFTNFVTKQHTNFFLTKEFHQTYTLLLYMKRTQNLDPQNSSSATPSSIFQQVNSTRPHFTPAAPRLPRSSFQRWRLLTFQHRHHDVTNEAPPTSLEHVQVRYTSFFHFDWKVIAIIIFSWILLCMGLCVWIYKELSIVLFPIMRLVMCLFWDDWYIREYSIKYLCKIYT